jgi:putative intracellular protease/amidase
MVLTSHDQLGDTGRKTGFWLEELAAPYYVFRDAGVDITLVSPKGGQPPIKLLESFIAQKKSRSPSSAMHQARCCAMPRIWTEPRSFGASASRASRTVRRRGLASPKSFLSSSRTNSASLIVRDGLLITGQKPASSGPTAGKLLEVLGK